MIPKDVRARWYYVIVMPVDAMTGHGPADMGEDVTLTWEVWDQELFLHGSFEFLPDAIQEAERLNDIYYGVVLK